MAPVKRYYVPCPFCARDMRMDSPRCRACSARANLIAYNSRPLPPARDRFWQKVSIRGVNDCWEYSGYRDKWGYGHFSIRKKPILAHRFAYEDVRGPIARDFPLDHLCRNTSCVNPNHLEVVTNQENCRRGLGGQNNAIKTHCPQGHVYSEENTYRWKHGDIVSRHCKRCNRVYGANYRARKRLDASDARRRSTHQP